MTHASSFVRVPPQSTGKRIATGERTQLTYDNQVGNFGLGRIVTGQTSGATGVITSIVTDGFVANEGQLWLKEVSGTFQNNENLQIDAVTIATSNTTIVPANTFDFQHNIIVDPENPNYQQRIDRFGATVNTFTDGSPVFGAFGTLTVGEPQVIKDYRFAYSGHDNDFWDNTSGSGSVSYESTSSTILLTNTTLSGDLSQRTSNFYHPYSPGVGQALEMSARIGDGGKANVRRRWGYFDDDNGVFFELNGTEIAVVLRSNVSGSVVDTRIIQEDWNLDPLDGSDSIGFELDVSAPNIYWIDLQWLGAGRIRFGVVEDSGARIVAHVIENANAAGTYPYMRTATLPIRIEQENLGVAASTSEMRVACVVVKHSSKVQSSGTKGSTHSGIKTIATASGEVPIFAYRPKTTFNGLPNRAILKGISSAFSNSTNTGGGLVLFRIRAGTEAMLTGHSFTSYAPTSTAEVDLSATAINPALSSLLFTLMVKADDAIFVQDIADRTLHTFEIFLNANGITQLALVITAECLTGTSADVSSIVNWEEFLG